MHKYLGSQIYGGMQLISKWYIFMTAMVKTKGWTNGFDLKYSYS